LVREIVGVRLFRRGAYRVVLEHVGHVVGGDEGVVHGDDLDVVAGEGGAHDEAADATEPVDAHADLLPLLRGGKNIGERVDDGVLGGAGRGGDAGGAPVDDVLGFVAVSFKSNAGA
jgi:hypothetical protein